MKLRTGFVSNSSSSSFVIGKYFMTQKQIEEFSALVKLFGQANYDNDVEVPIEFKDYLIEADENTYINEDDKYFYGTIGHVHYETMIQFMHKYNLETKYSVE